VDESSLLADEVDDQKANTPGSVDVTNTQIGRTPNRKAILSQYSFLQHTTNEAFVTLELL
jgi:hypothetical protein